MSRIGKQPIPILTGAKVTITGNRVDVEGPKGKLTHRLPDGITIKPAEDNTLQVSRRSDERSQKALHGLSRSLVFNMVFGVVNGFTKKLDIVGVGYGGKLEGRTLSITVGFSHPVIFQIPDGITITLPNQSLVVITGADKQQVGEMAASIRRSRPPEPYGGKGIKYEDEVIKRKAGKAFAGGGG